MVKRTKRGTVTESAHKEYGDKNAKFPIFDEKSAMAAIKLRHNSPTTDPGSVLSRASSWASSNDSDAVKKAVAKARAVDKKG